MHPRWRPISWNPNRNPCARITLAEATDMDRRKPLLRALFAVNQHAYDEIGFARYIKAWRQMHPESVLDVDVSFGKDWTRRQS